MLALGLGAGAILAKTGLVKIPLLSEVFYSPLAPSRRLAVDERQISGAAIDWQNSAGKGELVISETQATALLNQFIRERQLNIAGLQAVFLPEQAEIYFQLRQPAAAVKILLQPRLEGGKFALTLKQINLGQLSLPAFIFNLGAKTVLQDKIKNFERIIQSSPWQELRLRERELILF